jgi:restriction system protein
MAVWLVRAGKSGEHETRFFGDGRIYLTWDEVTGSLAQFTSNEGIRELLRPIYPDIPIGRLSSWTGQIGGFLLRMKLGDLVVTPRKGRGQYAIGEITGDYTYDPGTPMPYRHSRTVKWINLEVPKASLDLDLQFSLNAIATICSVNRERADERVRAVATGKHVALPKAPTYTGDTEVPEEEQPDLERVARAQIAQHIIQKFKGHRSLNSLGPFWKRRATPLS